MIIEILALASALGIPDALGTLAKGSLALRILGKSLDEELVDTKFGPLTHEEVGRHRVAELTGDTAGMAEVEAKGGERRQDILNSLSAGPLERQKALAKTVGEGLKKYI